MMFDSFLQRFSSVAFFFLTKYCFWFIWILFMWVSTGRFAVFVHTACFNESGDFIFDWFHSNFVLTFLPPASPFVHNHSVFKWLWRLHFWLISFKFCLQFATVSISIHIHRSWRSVLNFILCAKYSLGSFRIRFVKVSAGQPRVSVCTTCTGRSLLHWIQTFSFMDCAALESFDFFRSCQSFKIENCSV